MQFETPGSPEKPDASKQHPIQRTWFWWSIAAAIILGSTFGTGVYTFQYAEGFSYFSKDPAACVNCHIMQPQYDSWLKSSHHTAATCSDCHLPHSLIPKWIAKAENGYLHSKGFTFQDFPEPIVITRKNARILQNNCISCHSDLIHDMTHGATSAEDAVNCMHCHRSVGHGDSVGLGRFDPQIHEFARKLKP
jgi:cytochrome c nitrite reductase small subunit